MSEHNPYQAPNTRVDERGTGRVDPTSLIPVGWGRRAAARIIDQLYFLLVGGGTGLVVGVTLGLLELAGVIEPGWENRLESDIPLLDNLLGIVGLMALHTLAEFIHGASLGKLLLGMRVLGRDGHQPTLAGAFLRQLAYPIDAFFFGLVAYRFMSSSRWEQRLGDRWGKTIVVRVGSLPHSHRRSGLQFVLGLGLGSIAAGTVLGVSYLLLAI
jgi:uncharacterized RDD family membrane protein YckC